MAERQSLFNRGDSKLKGRDTGFVHGERVHKEVEKDRPFVEVVKGH